MRNLESENDAYVVAENLEEAIVLYTKSYSVRPDYILRLDGNLTRLLTEVKDV